MLLIRLVHSWQSMLAGTFSFWLVAMWSLPGLLRVKALRGLAPWDGAKLFL